MTKAKLSPAQREMLRHCSQCVGGVITRTARNRRTADALERAGLVTVRFRDPATWAQAHRPRLYYITITNAGRAALRKQ